MSKRPFRSRFHIVRRKDNISLLVYPFGVTIWRHGALSFIGPIGTSGVPLQIVFGDWWQARPDVAREHAAHRRYRRTHA